MSIQHENEIRIEMPGERPWTFRHLLMDFTGTLSVSGLLEQIGTMRQQLVEIRDDLGLPGEVRQTRHDIWSRASSFWENLVELEAKYLSAYGDPTPELIEYLEPQVKQLTHELEQLCAIVHHTL